MARSKRKSKPRRKTSRGSGKRRAAPAKKPQPEYHAVWLYETLSVVCGVVAALLLISFIFHRAQLSAAGVDSSRNLIGPAGHFLATLLSGAFGWAGLLPGLGFAWLSLRFWKGPIEVKRSEGYSGYSFVVGLIVTLISFCGLLATLWGEQSGGDLGSALAVPLSHIISPIGSSIVFAGGLLLSLSLVFRCGVSGLLMAALKLLGQIAIHLLFTLPGILARLAVEAVRAAGWLWRQAIPAREYTEQPLDDLEVPTPKRHRAEVSTDDEEFDSQATEVVVKRRSAATNKERSNIKRLRKPGNVVVEKDDPFKDYVPPELSLLTRSKAEVRVEDDETLREKSRQIESKLKDFGIGGRVTEVHPGPVVTLFEVEPATGVKVSKISSLHNDLAMALKARAIRIIAPIPGKGTVGIEVPNSQREMVRLRDVLESKAYIDAESILSTCIGKDIYGDPVVRDISRMPHLLMAGATGTGKSVCINTLLLSLLYRATPSELGLILIDPKMLELSIYDGIPHLKVPVVTDSRQARAVLQWAVDEMHQRYKLMKAHGVRSIDGYNRLVAGEPNDEDKELIRLTEERMVEPGVEEHLSALVDDESREAQRSIVQEPLKPLPKIVIVIDELADLMLSVRREVEDLITRLAQLARAAGIHLIVATQRPSTDVITGLIKANFPARLSFRVSSGVDSRTILDGVGAEKLLDRGDMLFMEPGGQALLRVHGSYASDEDVKKVVKALKKAGKPVYDERIMALMEKALEEEGSASSGMQGSDEYDPLYDQAVEIVRSKGKASTSMIQRHLSIGYNRAARIIDCMESEGVVGPPDGSRPREVLMPIHDE